MGGISSLVGDWSYHYTTKMELETLRRIRERVVGLRGLLCRRVMQPILRSVWTEEISSRSSHHLNQSYRFQSSTVLRIVLFRVDRLPWLGNDIMSVSHMKRDIKIRRSGQGRPSVSMRNMVSVCTDVSELDYELYTNQILIAQIASQYFSPRDSQHSITSNLRCLTGSNILPAGTHGQHNDDPRNSPIQITRCLSYNSPTNPQSSN